MRDQNCSTLISLEFSVLNPEMSFTHNIPSPLSSRRANSSYLASDIKSNLVYLPPFSVFFAEDEGKPYIDTDEWER